MIKQSENRHEIESNGDRFDLNRLLAVRHRTRVAIAEIARQIVSGMAEDEAFEEALIDVTTAGNCGHHIMSDHWGIELEGPSRADLRSIGEWVPW